MHSHQFLLSLESFSFSSGSRILMGKQTLVVSNPSFHLCLSASLSSTHSLALSLWRRARTRHRRGYLEGIENELGAGALGSSRKETHTERWLHCGDADTTAQSITIGPEASRRRRGRGSGAKREWKWNAERASQQGRKNERADGEEAAACPFRPPLFHFSPASLPVALFLL